MTGLKHWDLGLNVHDRMVIQKRGNHGHRDRKGGGAINSHTPVAVAAEANVRITVIFFYAKTPLPQTEVL